MNFRKELGLSNKLKLSLGMNEDDNYNAFQKKLIQNVRYCADNQWQYVNSYYDGYKEDAYNFFENAINVYDTIYEDSGTDVFGPGSQHWGKDAEEYLKDTRFAGKRFKQLVVLFYTAKLYEEAVPEIEFTDAQNNKVLEQLKEIKAFIS